MLVPPFNSDREVDSVFQKVVDHRADLQTLRDVQFAVDFHRASFNQAFLGFGRQESLRLQFFFTFEPDMVQSLFRTRSGLWVLSQEGTHKVYGVGADVFPAFEAKLFIGDLGYKLWNLVVKKWLISV